MHRVGVPQRLSARAFHTSGVNLAFKKSTGSQAAQQRMQTPRKGSTEFRAFAEAAAYSRHHLTAPELEAHVPVVLAETLQDIKPGTVVTWPGDVQAQLTHLGSFRPQQRNELFRTHSTLVRGATQRIVQEHLQGGKSLFITGDAGVGKSSLLSQAHAAAKLQGWAVVHISQANLLVDGSVDAVYNKTTGLWDQPMFMGRLWKKALKGNRELKDVIEGGDKKTLKSLLDVLSSKAKVLLTVDDVNAWSSMPFAANTNEKNQRLYHRDLEVPATFLNQVSEPSANVCVMTASTGAYKPIAMQGHAYARIQEFDPKLAASLLKASHLDLGRLDAEETQAYVDYLKQTQIAKSDSWREQFQASGNGNPREILRSCINYAF